MNQSSSKIRQPKEVKSPENSADLSDKGVMVTLYCSPEHPLLKNLRTGGIKLNVVSLGLLEKAIFISLETDTQKLYMKKVSTDVIQKLLGGEKIVGACDVVDGGAGLSQGVGTLIDTGFAKDAGNGLKQGDSREVSALLAAEQRLKSVNRFPMLTLEFYELTNRMTDSLTQANRPLFAEFSGFAPDGHIGLDLASVVHIADGQADQFGGA